MGSEEVVTLFFLTAAILAYLGTLAWQLVDEEEEDRE